MKKAVIFDLDGTLLDTFPGIMESANEVAIRLGCRRVDDRKAFEPFTSLPLEIGFPAVFSLEKERAPEARDGFMREYEEKGCLSYDYYPGMLEMVSALRDEGIILAVSTLKTESAAKKMLASSGYGGFFSSIRGNNENDDAEKSELIRTVLSDIDISAGDAVVVGDTLSDMTGAFRAGVDFIGVDWGFGKLPRSRRPLVVSTPSEVKKAVIGNGKK